MNDVMEPLVRLDRDLRAAARLLGRNAVRGLTDYYYAVQGFRTRAANQVRAAQEGEPARVIEWVFANARTLEHDIRRALGEFAAEYRCGQWLQAITGIGPVISAGLLAHLDVSRAKTAGHFWRFCLPPGTLVSVPGGYCAIEEIQPGSIVYDRAGKPTSVVAVAGRLFTGTMITMQAVSAPPLRLTDNHPLWVVRRGGEGAEWIEAGAIEIGDHIFMPRVQHASSASPQLALGIQRLLHGIGVQGNVNIQRRGLQEVVSQEIRGRAVLSRSERWTLNINGRHLAMLEVGTEFLPSCYENRRVITDENGSWCPVFAVGREQVENVLVYDLQTEVESFVANNIAVHNSGLDPTVKWEKKTKRPWNARLKKLLYLTCDCFVKFQNHENDHYGKLYVQRKAREQDLNEAGAFAEQAAQALATKKFRDDTKAKVCYEKGVLPPGHIHMRAMRWTEKIFLSHLHRVMYLDYFGEEPPVPYVFAKCAGDHRHFIELPVPFDWGGPGRSLREMGT